MRLTLILVARKKGKKRNKQLYGQIVPLMLSNYAFYNNLKLASTFEIISSSGSSSTMPQWQLLLLFILNSRPQGTFPGDTGVFQSQQSDAGRSQF